MARAPHAGRPPQLPDGFTLICVSATDAFFASLEELEYSVFLDSGYVEPNTFKRVLEYDPWIDRSEFLAVLDQNHEAVGCVRVLIGDYASLPLGRLERTVYDLPDPVCEYASLAVSPHKRSTGVAEELYRAVWLHARAHGASGLVALVDPWLHELLRDYYGFPFERLGPTTRYMGGDVHPIGMSLRIGEMSLRIGEALVPTIRPELWEWLAEGAAARQSHDGQRLDRLPG